MPKQPSRHPLIHNALTGLASATNAGHFRRQSSSVDWQTAEGDAQLFRMGRD
jgi:hypothetical protein